MPVMLNTSTGISNSAYENLYSPSITDARSRTIAVKFASNNTIKAHCRLKGSMQTSMYSNAYGMIDPPAPRSMPIITGFVSASEIPFISTCGLKINTSPIRRK